MPSKAKPEAKSKTKPATQAPAPAVPTDEELNAALAEVDAWRANVRQRGWEIYRKLENRPFMTKAGVRLLRCPSGVGFAPQWALWAQEAGYTEAQVRAMRNDREAQQAVCAVYRLKAPKSDDGK